MAGMCCGGDVNSSWKQEGNLPSPASHSPLELHAVTCPQATGCKNIMGSRVSSLHQNGALWGGLGAKSL